MSMMTKKGQVTIYDNGNGLSDWVLNSSIGFAQG